jgi:hypothetical protein
VTVWRRAAVGLIAGAATAIAAIPAQAGPVRAVAVGPAGVRPVAVSSPKPAYPLPAHRHHPTRAHVAATTGSNSKRVAGPAGAIAAPSVPVTAAVGFAVRAITTTAPHQRIERALAARAPPVRQ